MAKGYDLDDAPVPERNKRPRVDEQVHLAKPGLKFTPYRLYGPIHAYGIHWVDIKKQDGSRTRFPTHCLAFDPATGKKDTTKECPWCAFEAANPQPRAKEGETQTKKGYYVSSSVDYYINALEQKLLSGAPADNEWTSKEKKSGYKDIDSETFTPWKVLQLTATAVRKVKALRELNVHEDADGNSQAFPVTHPKYGRWINVKIDKNASPAERFQVAPGQEAPMKKAYKVFPMWDLSNLMPPLTYEEVLQEYKEWITRNKLAEKDPLASSGKSSKKSKKEEDDDDDDDSGLDEDAAPWDKKAKAKPSKKKVVDDEEDDDDDDDEEDLKPAKGKKPAPKKKVVDDDEDDEDDY